MLSILRKRKYLINVLFLLIAIGLEIFYSICGGSCSYLRGDIFGMDLTYVGIVFAVILIGLSLLKQDRLILVLLSAGVGVEIVLVAFQVRKDVYCPYCLAFAAVILLLFVLNFDVTQKALIAGSVILGFLLFALFFKGSVTPTYAGPNGTPFKATSEVVLGHSDMKTIQVHPGKVTTRHSSAPPEKTFAQGGLCDTFGTRNA